MNIDTKIYGTLKVSTDRSNQVTLLDSATGEAIRVPAYMAAWARKQLRDKHDAELIWRRVFNSLR
tara:strand:- start:27 stop:221 length:195 start_codon:yes stop_codon:yes gene_type:complete